MEASMFEGDVFPLHFAISSSRFGTFVVVRICIMCRSKFDITGESFDAVLNDELDSGCFDQCAIAPGRLKPLEAFERVPVLLLVFLPSFRSQRFQGVHFAGIL